MIQTWKELVTYSFDKRQLHTLGLSDDVSLLFSKHPPISSTSVNFVHKPLYIQIIGMLRAAKTWVFYQVLTHFPLHTPIKNPLVYDFYMNYFTWPRVHLLTSMLSFLCPPKKSKLTLGPRVGPALILRKSSKSGVPCHCPGTPLTMALWYCLSLDQLELLKLG